MTGVFLGGHLQFFLAPSLATEGAARSTIKGFSGVVYSKVLFRSTNHIH